MLSFLADNQQYLEKFLDVIQTIVSEEKANINRIFGKYRLYHIVCKRNQ